MSKDNGTLQDISCVCNYISIKVDEENSTLMNANKAQEKKIETLADMHIKYLFYPLLHAHFYLMLFH